MATNSMSFTIDDEVTYVVEKKIQDDHHPLLTKGFPFFEWAPGVPILDDEQQVPEDPGEFLEF